MGEQFLLERIFLPEHWILQSLDGDKSEGAHGLHEACLYVLEFL